tara:strand:+ start:185 stop:406 length:222 start_codon:yes stop_codon:yes gene_type:complete
MKIKIFKDSDKEQTTPIKILNVSPGKKSWEQLIKFCEENNISDALSIQINDFVLYGWDEIDEWLLAGAPNWAR